MAAGLAARSAAGTVTYSAAAPGRSKPTRLYTSAPSVQLVPPGPEAATTPERSWHGMTGQVSGQVSSWAVTAVAATRTSTSPGAGGGTGTWSRLRLVGSLDEARMARIVPSGLFIGAASLVGGERDSAEDPRVGSDALALAPVQVDSALAGRAHGLGDLAIKTEVLDGSGHLEVDDAGPVAGRAPGVNGAGGLVDVVARPDELAGPQDLTRPGDVESVQFAGVPVQGHHAARFQAHQLRPAVRCEAQRTEGLARTGRYPGHGVGVQGQGGFGGQLLHGRSPLVIRRLVLARYRSYGLASRSKFTQNDQA